MYNIDIIIILIIITNIKFDCIKSNINNNYLYYVYIIIFYIIN